MLLPDLDRRVSEATLKSTNNSKKSKLATQSKQNTENYQNGQKVCLGTSTENLIFYLKNSAKAKK